VRRRQFDPSFVTLGAGALAMVLVVALVLPADTPASQALLERITAAAAAPPTAIAPAAATAPAGATSPTAAPAPTTPAPAAPLALAARPHVELLGDSIAFSLALTLPHARSQAEFEIGCGVGPNIVAAGLDGSPCAELTDRLAADAAARRIDVVVVASCQWELVSQRLPGESSKRSPGDPVYDAYVLGMYRNTVQQLRAAGVARVLWIRCPRMSQVVRPADLSAELLASRAPTRMAALGAIVDRLAAEDGVQVLDLATWVEARLDDAALRPDGAHFDWDHDSGVAAELTRLINDALAR
jgi:SGNH domain (fused to AT3 domains)